MANLKGIFRYPVKGLGLDSLRAVKLEVGKQMPQDRLYALALSDTKFDKTNPEYLRKTNFLMLMRDEKLAELNIEFLDEAERMIVSHNNQVCLDVLLSSKEASDTLGAFFEEFMGGKLKGRPRLVTAPNHMFADVPDKNLSLINLDTVRDIEEKTGLSVDPNRFRGNLLVEGFGAWEEFECLGRTVQIGDVTFTVKKRIDRCAATNVNLETAERDMNLPLAIRKAFGHIDCGVYVDVTKGGLLNIGDAVQILE